jgi:hypothetical protein
MMNEGDSQLRALRDALSRGSQPTDIQHLMPVIVPRSYFQLGNWPGPYLNLRHVELGLTWVIPTPGQTMLYLTRERAADWERDGIDWRTQAFENLRQRSEPIWTHTKVDISHGLLFASMMHDDGLGSSRALLDADIKRQVNGRYQIAVPDRSCALVFPAPTRSVNGRTTVDMIREMYQRATTPLCGKLLEPEDLGVEGETSG